MKKEAAVFILAGALAWGTAQAAGPFGESDPKSAKEAPAPTAVEASPQTPAASAVTIVTGEITRIDAATGRFSVADRQGGTQEGILIVPGTAFNKTVGRTSTPLPGAIADLKPGVLVRVGYVNQGKEKTALRVSYKVS